MAKNGYRPGDYSQSSLGKQAIFVCGHTPALKTLKSGVAMIPLLQFSAGWAIVSATDLPD
jgi:hypothetical protein